MNPRSLMLMPFLFCSLVQAGSAVELNVNGWITPSACQPTLSDDGRYDLGKIAAWSLNRDRPTPLPTRELPLEITCEALTLLALEPKDNRSGSSYAGDHTSRFGLGWVNGNIRLGYLELRVGSIMADGVLMHPIGSSGPSTWAPTAILSPHFLTAFTPVETVVIPAPVQTLQANLQIAPAIAPANTLPLTEDVPIDGSITLTLKYL